MFRLPPDPYEWMGVKAKIEKSASVLMPNTFENNDLIIFEDSSQLQKITEFSKLNEVFAKSK